MGDSVGALADLDHLVQIDPQIAWALAERGELK